MIGRDQAQDALGATVYGTGGEKIGKVGAVFVDDQSGEPEFATVHTGLFGRKETFVPLQSAELGHDGLNVPYGVQQVKDAPNMEVEDGHLSQAEENALYQYYGIDPSGGTTPGQAMHAADPALSDGRPDAVMDPTGPPDPLLSPVAEEPMPTGRHAAESEAAPAEDAMTRPDVESGRARLRRYVVTEEVRIEEVGPGEDPRTP
ncbi:MAG TPA: PRC-barrel domain-containing protein [Mycobacteriales bacterium]|nr:PRC-barrel domain-containing protein [Mycobacteriales bacterium]